MPAATYFGAKLFIANRTNHGQWLRFADACRYELAGPAPVAGLLNAAAGRIGVALDFLDRRYEVGLSPGSKLWSRVGAVAVHAGAGGETMLERIVDEHTSVDPTPSSHCAQAELAIADRYFWHRREDGRRRLLRLRADGTVTGGTARERLWFVEGDGAERRLVLADESNVTCELVRSGSTWRGHSTCPAAGGGRLVVLEPARGERLVDLLRSAGREPRDGLVIGGAEGLTCSILLERLPKLSLRIVLAGVRGTDRADARADLVHATRPWAARRFIINAPCSDAALSALPERPLDFAYFAAFDGIPSEAAPGWLSKLAVGSLIVGERGDDFGEQPQTTLRRTAKAVASVPAEEEELWWCRTTRAIPSPRPSTPRRWVGPSEVTEATAAEVAADFLRNLGPYPTGSLSGRGIVTCAGGTRYLPCGWVCIQMLRRLGCTLPVEIWSLGPTEIDADASRLFEPLGVRCVDASEVAERHPVRILNGWELKPFSILHSAFGEVLFLDADDVPARDPTDLFESAEYRRTGAVFWPDFGRLGPQRTIWDVCRVPYRDEPEFETGQVVVHKARCWRAMQLTMHLNEYSDFYYRHIHGDKETFHMAWRMLRQEYSMVSWPIHALRGVMCQHDFEGRRVFQHRNLAKWELEGPNQHIPGFMHEDECLGFLEDLRRRWDGRIGHGRPATAAELDAARELVRIGRFRYVRVGHDSRRIELQDGGRVGEGRAACEEFWYTREGSRRHESGDRRKRAGYMPPREIDRRYLARQVVDWRAHGDRIGSACSCDARSLPWESSTSSQSGGED